MSFQGHFPVSVLIVGPVGLDSAFLEPGGFFFLFLSSVFLFSLLFGSLRS